MSNVIIPIDTLGADIAARICAGDKAMSKADEHYLAAGIHLLEARTRLQQSHEMRWSAFLFSCCKGLSSSRAYELINIAEGKTTSEEIREKARARKQRFEARNREAREVVSSVPNGTPKPPAPDEGRDGDIVADLRRQVADLTDQNKKLSADLAEAKETIAEKESARRFNDARAAQAEAQRDRAQTEAAFLRSDHERLAEEMARLMADMDALTTPSASLESFNPDRDVPAFLRRAAT